MRLEQDPRGEAVLGRWITLEHKIAVTATISADLSFDRVRKRLAQPDSLAHTTSAPLVSCPTGQSSEPLSTLSSVTLEVKSSAYRAPHRRQLSFCPISKSLWLFA